MTKQRLSSPYDALPPADFTMTIAARSLGVACGGGLTVTLHSTDDVRVIVLDGAVGPDSRLGLFSPLNAAFMSSPRRIVIDASHVTDCDRQGLVAFKISASRPPAIRLARNCSTMSVVCTRP